MIIHNSNKFNATTVSIRFKEEINKDTVGLRALLPALLIVKTQSYNSRKKLSEALETLYGASLSARTTKLGKLSVLNITLSIVNHSITGIEVFEEGLKLLNEAVFGHKNLSKADFEIEKTMLLRAIEAKKDNKTSYALARMNEIMFKNEIYGIDISGKKDDVEPVLYNDLNNYYKKLIKDNIYDVVVSGPITEEVEDLIKKYFKPNKGNNFNVIDYENKEISNKQFVEEYDFINQAKVNLGYRFPIRFNDPLYYAALVFNTTLGGAVHSRLFLNVREKLSLCYYISSRYDSFKGYMFIYSGIDKDRVDVAFNEIDRQIFDLKTNQISNEELDQSKKFLINNLKESEDNQNTMVAKIYRDTLLGSTKTLDEIIENINSVTALEVLDVANKLVADTTYVLAPEENNEV